MGEPMIETAVRPAVTPVRFRSLMATFPAGVAVVTAGNPDAGMFGMTCTAMSSVSDHPATLLVCIQRTSRTLAVMLRTSTFAVNLLDRDSRSVAELFASSTADYFSQVRWTCEPSYGGPHLVDHTHTIGDCRVTKTVVVGDHTVVFGEVFNVAAMGRQPPTPLLYGMRNYWALTEQR
jgi:flavin reductase (DIM6/NTAB) family NADH-FMN oxidoreductase RutF